MKRTWRLWLTLGILAAPLVELAGVAYFRLHIRSLNDLEAHALLAKRTGTVWFDIVFDRLQAGDSLEDFIGSRRPGWDVVFGDGARRKNLPPFP